MMETDGVEQPSVGSLIRTVDSVTSSPQEKVDALEELVSMGKVRGAQLADPAPLVKCMRGLLVSGSSFLRRCGLRLMRHWMADIGVQRKCWELRLDWFVARSMDRTEDKRDKEKRVERERDLAFRLLGRVVELHVKYHRQQADRREGRAAPAAGFEQPPQSLQTVLGESLASAPPGSSIGQRSASPSRPSSYGRGASGLPGAAEARADGSDPRHSLTPTPELEPQPELPRGLLMRLVSVGETAEDPNQRRALVLLRDLFVASPQLVSNANAVRTLISALCDTDLHDMHQGIIQAVLYVLDYSESRRFVRLQLDYQLILGPLTVSHKGDAVDALKKRVKCAKEVLLTCLRTWTGLLTLANDPRGLLPLIDTLRLPGATWRKMAIFEVLHNAIRTAAPHRGLPAGGPWTGETDGEHRMDDDRGRQAEHEETAGMGGGGDHRAVRVNVSPGHNVLDIYLGALLLALSNCGLPATLISLVRQGMTDESRSADGKDDGDVSEADVALVSQAAAQLLQTFLLLVDSLFPQKYALEVFAAFDHAIAGLLDNPIPNRSRELAPTSKVRQMTSTLFTKIVYTSAPRRELSAEALKSINLQMSSNLEDSHFRILMTDSQVTVTKDRSRWKCETVLYLIKGPLRLHSRLQETLKTKFFKRLLSFLKPRKRLFADLTYTEENLVYSEVACGLIELLLQSKEGAKHLAESGLLEELNAILGEVLSTSVHENHKVLNKERIKYTMSREYLKMIGRMSESAAGTELLAQNNIFKSLQALMDSKSKEQDDIRHQILKHLSLAGIDARSAEARIFDKAITDGCKPMRLIATRRLRDSFRHGCRDSMDWALNLLVAQLADSWKDVATEAYEIINEWCEADSEVLELFIGRRPGLATFTRREGSEEHAERLLLRMLNRPSGFRYLEEQGVVQRQVEEWRSGKCVEWALGVERAVAKALTAPRGGDDVRQRRGKATAAVSLAPPHLYGELAKTPQGVSYLRRCGAWGDLTATIEDGMEWDEPHVAPADGASPHSPPFRSEDGEELVVRPSALAKSGRGPNSRHSVFVYFQQGDGDEGDIRDYGGDDDFARRGTDNRDEPPADTSRRPSYGLGLMRRQSTARALVPPMEESPKVAPPRPAPSWQDGDDTGYNHHAPQASQTPVRVRNSAAFRAALWAVSQVAGSDDGAVFVEGAEGGALLRRLIAIATSADCLSIRGTMLIGLSFIARSARGRKALTDLGWLTGSGDGYTAVDGTWYVPCFCFPKASASWCHVHEEDFSSVPCDLTHGAAMDTLEPKRFKQGANETALDAILNHVRMLSNPVSADTAALKKLKRLCETYPSVAKSPQLAFGVHELLNTRRFRTTPRKTIYDLFETVVYTPESFEKLDATPRAETQAVHPTARLGAASRVLEHRSPPAHRDPTPHREPAPHRDADRRARPGSPAAGAASPAARSASTVATSPAVSPAGSVSPERKRGRSRVQSTPPPPEPPSAPLSGLLQGLTDPATVSDGARIRALVGAAVEGPEGLIVNQVLAGAQYGWDGDTFDPPLTSNTAVTLACALRKYTS